MGIDSFIKVLSFKKVSDYDLISIHLFWLVNQSIKQIIHLSFFQSVCIVHGSYWYRMDPNRAKLCRAFPLHPEYHIFPGTSDMRRLCDSCPLEASK